MRRRLLSIIALLMLFTSAFSTETAEVWCRVATGATMDLDDDDGMYFVCRPIGEGAAPPAAANHKEAKSATLFAPSSQRTIPDEPTFPMPTLGAYVLPSAFTQVAVNWTSVIYGIEARGPPPSQPDFVFPPPRAPPVF